jgi:hypothetical protein
MCWLRLHNCTHRDRVEFFPNDEEWDALVNDGLMRTASACPASPVFDGRNVRLGAKTEVAA